MDKIFEALLKIIPFARLFEKIGFNKEISVVLAAIVISILLYCLSLLSKYLINHYKNSNAAKDLNPYFDYKKVKASRELFIPTQYQNASPTREEEPSFSHKFVAKKPLIPFFLKEALNEKKISDKYYLILADSGMGKTTFMINLYVKNYSFLNFRRKYEMSLFPLGDSRTLDVIKKIKPEEARNTILLLDAFDEDKNLIPPNEPDGMSDDERFRKRLDEIIETMRDFREVIITSRTQYFPGQESQPYELKIPKFDDTGYHKLAKLYLSPFDSKEIKRYLNKKYGVIRFWNRKKKKNAVRIVNASPKLMVRPMLLSYIDYLVESNRSFKTTYEIYETLVG
jgi:formylglycine-generating enzyme